MQLPEGDLSYLLQEWDQLLGTEQAFGLVRETLETVLGLRQSVDTLERGSRQMAEAAPAFRQSQPAPNPEDEGRLLVVTEDNKGVPMVRPVAAAPAGSHRKKGEKANKKQMACIGCVYTVDPHFRTAHEVVATLFRAPDRPRKQPPEARQKRYWTALSREEEGRMVRGQDEVFQHLRDDVTLRRRPRQTVVHLCDGQHSLETDRHKYLPQDPHTVDVLDLMHVLPRLWEAAHLFHREGSDAASQFVRDRLYHVLEGSAGRVIGGLRQMGTKHKFAARPKNVCGNCASSWRAICIACVTMSTWPADIRLPLESLRAPVVTSSRTAWNAPGCVGKCRGHRRCCICVPFVPMGTGEPSRTLASSMRSSGCIHTRTPFEMSPGIWRFEHPGFAGAKPVTPFSI